jgi:hypothetical protein
MHKVINSELFCSVCNLHRYLQQLISVFGNQVQNFSGRRNPIFSSVTKPVFAGFQLTITGTFSQAVSCSSSSLLKMITDSIIIGIGEIIPISEWCPRLKMVAYTVILRFSIEK